MSFKSTRALGQPEKLFLSALHSSCLCFDSCAFAIIPRFVRRCLMYCFIISSLAFGKCVHKKLLFPCPMIIKIGRLHFSRKIKKSTLKLITGRRGIAKQLSYVSDFNNKLMTIIGHTDTRVEHFVYSQTL